MNSSRDILARLVAFPTISDQSNLELIQYVTDYLNHYKLEVHHVWDVQEEKASLHCRIGPATDGGVILSGHTDVVPVEGQPWSTDPFQLVEREGKLYARGATDMKGFLACCLANIPKMLSADLKHPVYLAFSYDEEVGCQAAPALIDHIKDTYEERPRFAIIGEPSEMQPVLGQKGIAVFRTTVTGSAGHSSRILQEVSAVHVAARLITLIEDKMDQLIRAGKVDGRFTPNHTTLHVGMVEGGIASNVIAGSCSFLWDVRVIPGAEAKDLLEAFQLQCREMERLLQSRFPGACIETIPLFTPVPPLDTPIDSSIATLIQQLSGSNQFETVSYAAEAGQFARAGFEAVICGPGSITEAHRANEFITIDQLEKGTAFIQRVIEWGEGK